ncbi:MAG: UbiD family decarboxylase [Syntrophorhabdaceae bacterium]|nr:UbiD family decarboxylase [Syntrophorhabdaceae bacterium]MDD5242543.1 UbiD family decarboxylase [Syntrophorhabdaceae bacterium]
MFEDLREWMKEVNKINELVVINGADTDDFGPVSQITSRNEAQAVIFDNVKGYKPGFRMAANMMQNIRTFNLALGLPLDYSIKQTIEVLTKKVAEWNEKSVQFDPVEVKDAPILENVKTGDEIDLSIFPVPKWHDFDGGPYIGTADNIITRDRETGLVNLGTYRSQLLNKNTVSIFISPGHHGRLHYEKYFEKGEPCPIVMVYGSDPTTFVISSQEIPEKISELNYIGAIRNKPVPVVKGKVTGLPIPAGAEVAVEGFLYPGQTMPEGPFGEWPGYYAGGVVDRPFLKPEVLYYRNNPILTGCPPAKAIWADQAFLRSVLRSALLYSEMLSANVPGVKGVWVPQVGGSRHLIIVAIEQRYAGHATQAGLVATGTRAGAMQGRYTIIVDDDIDIYDMEDVMWAICTRSRPHETDLIKVTWSTETDPTIRKPSENLTTSRAIIYAVRPWEWRDEFPKVDMATAETRTEVLNKYKDLFGGRWKQI